jgi:L-iditol 2-dehydrogenase
MNVARLHAPGQILLHNESEPIPALGETLVRVRLVGICGSDLHWFSGGAIGDARLGHPLVLGHEAAGETKAGVRVAVDPAIPCGHCEWCRKGDPNLCPNVLFAGHGEQDGAMRESMNWPEACLHALPEALTDTDAVLLEPLGVALHAVDLAHLRTGMTVGVFGCGPIGLLVVQLARLSGAGQIIATDLHTHRLEAARGFGAHVTIQAAGGTELDQVRAATGGRGVDVAFEVAGEQAAVDTAVGAACPGGMVILAGIPANDHTGFIASTARRKGLTMKLVRRMKHTYPRAIELVATGRVELHSLVTQRFPLGRVAEAFAVAQRREGLKVVVEL